MVVAVERLTNAAPEGGVLRQSEPPGSRIEVGDTITLTIARPLPKIPNVVGKTLANARRTLRNAGFEVGKVTQQTSSERKGPVISQSPDGGISASRPIGLACDGEARSSARVGASELHARLLALPASRFRLRLRRWVRRRPEVHGQGHGHRL